MSTEVIKQAAERRAAKKAQQEAARAQAERDALVRKEDVLRKQAAEVQTPRAERQSRKEAAVAAQHRAEKQAAADAARVPPTAEEIAGSYVLKAGEVPSLHVLNARAKLVSEATKDVAREIANAAGKAAFETAQGRVARGPHNRYKKLRTAEAALAAAATAAETKEA